MQTSIAYMRFSSKRQATGRSEARQEQDFLDFCNRNKLNKWQEIYWSKGDSAYHGIHREKDFGRLLADCDSQKFPAGSVLWFEDMDRFGRGKLATVLADWERIISAGYSIHVSSLGTTFDANTGQMELIAVVMKAILAHDESAKKADRQRKSWKLRRESGKPVTTICPCWLEWNGTEFVYSALWEPMKRAIALSIEGYGAGQIKAKIPELPPGLVTLLRQKTLLGEYQPCTRKGKNARVPCGDPIEGYYPALITLATWDKLQAALDSRKTQKGPRGKDTVANLFQGLIFDGTTEKQMVCYTNSRGGKLIKGKGPGHKQIQVEVLEAGLLNFLGELSPADLLPQVRLEGQSQVETLTQQLVDINGKIEAVQAMLLGRGNNTLIDTLSKLDSKRVELQDQIEQARRQHSTSEADLLTEAQTVVGLLADTEDKVGTRTRLKALIRGLVERIEVTVLSSTKAMVGVALRTGVTRVGVVQDHSWLASEWASEDQVKFYGSDVPTQSYSFSG